MIQAVTTDDTGGYSVTIPYDTSTIYFRLSSFQLSPHFEVRNQLDSTRHFSATWNSMMDATSDRNIDVELDSALVAGVDSSLYAAARIQRDLPDTKNIFQQPRSEPVLSQTGLALSVDSDHSVVRMFESSFVR